MAAQGLAGGIDPSTSVFGGPSPKANTSASTFVVETYDPQTLQTIDSLVLQGRALPYRKPKYGGKQKVIIEWYPGNPVGTSQVLGPEEMPTNFNGMWKDRFVAAAVSDGTVDSVAPPATLNGQTLDGAYAIYLVCDRFRRQGLPVRVTWDQLVRLGFIEEFTGAFERHQDIEWEMKFAWISQDDPDVPPNNPTSPDIASASQAFQDAINGVSSAIFNASDSLQTAISISDFASDAYSIELLSAQVSYAEQGVTDQINADINTMQTLADGMSDTNNSLVASTLAPVEASQRSAALGQLMFETGLDIVDQLEQNTAQALYAPTPSGPGLLAEVLTWGQVTAGNGMAAKLSIRDLKDSTRDAAYTGSQQALAFLQSTSQPDLIQAFVAQAGDDLRRISTAAYGTPDEWISIMSFNGLSSSALTAGQVVFVSVRRAGS